MYISLQIKVPHYLHLSSGCEAALCVGRNGFSAKGCQERDVSLADPGSAYQLSFIFKGNNFLAQIVRCCYLGLDLTVLWKVWLLLSNIQMFNCNCCKKQDTLAISGLICTVKPSYSYSLARPFNWTTVLVPLCKAQCEVDLLANKGSTMLQ